MGRALVNRNNVLRIIDPEGKYVMFVVSHPIYPSCTIRRFFDVDFKDKNPKEILDQVESITEEYIDIFVEDANISFNKIEEDESNHICKRSNEAGGTQETDLNSSDNGSTPNS